MTLASGIRLTLGIDLDDNADPGYGLITAPHHDVGLDKFMLDRFFTRC